MNWTDIRVGVGRIWGATTTIVISLAAGLTAATLDPEYGPALRDLMTAYAPWAPKAITVLGAAAVLLRAISKKAD